MVTLRRSTIVDAPLAEVWALLRDFNGHDQWHPAVTSSHMQGGAPSTQIGGVRDFRLASGDRVCERLIRLSDRERSFTYTITRSDVPLMDYVAHVELKPVTEGSRTFWRWHSKFNAPRGREDELKKLVAEGVYRVGFQGARAYLGAALEPEPGTSMETGDTARAIVATRHGGPDVFAYQTVTAPQAGAGRGAHPPDSHRRELYRRLHPHRVFQPDTTARHPWDGGRRHRHRHRPRRAPPE